MCPRQMRCSDASISSPQPRTPNCRAPDCTRPEPEDFDERVRQPGVKAINESRTPLPDYWRRCSHQLREEYKEICAYSFLRIPKVVGSNMVEHLAPKSKQPALAYEWGNYRLVCGLMNSRKRDFEHVLDPFEIGEDWFELELVFSS